MYGLGLNSSTRLLDFQRGPERWLFSHKAWRGRPGTTCVHGGCFHLFPHGLELWPECGTMVLRKDHESHCTVPTESGEPCLRLTRRFIRHGPTIQRNTQTTKRRNDSDGHEQSIYTDIPPPASHKDVVRGEQKGLNIFWIIVEKATWVPSLTQKFKNDFVCGARHLRRYAPTHQRQIPPKLIRCFFCLASAVSASVVDAWIQPRELFDALKPP